MATDPCLENIFQSINMSYEQRETFFTDFNPFQPSVAFQIETIHLLNSSKQMTGFYMKRNTGLKWFNLDCFTQNKETINLA